jgi:ATP-dependent Clp protease protease subunit|tara:strand:+ start:765 stop:1397 length:633 start_codon:yes stop_codon:yes gene_type:complete
MFNSIINGSKKSKSSKKNKNKEDVTAPPQIQAPGTYVREAGILFLTEKFDQEKIMPLVAQIYEYNIMPEELRPENITLVINSPGGSVHSAFHLIDAMMMSEVPVNTIGHGLVASCGVLTIMAGKRRMVTHNTSVMSHQYSWGSQGKEHELHAKFKEFDMAGIRMENHYRKFTKKSVKYIRKHLLHATDEWLTPDECLKHGLVDEVINTYS